MDEFVSILVALFMCALFASILLFAVWFLVRKILGAGNRNCDRTHDHRKSIL